MTSSLSLEQIQALNSLPIPLDVKIALLNGKICFSDFGKTDSIIATRPHLPQSEGSALTSASTMQTATDSFTIKTKANVDFNYKILLAVLCKVDEENPFTGDSTARSKAWKAVHDCYLNEGGNKVNSGDWLKKKVTECLNIHEEFRKSKDPNEERNVKLPKGSKPTQLIRDLFEKNHIAFASIVEAIAHQRIQSYTESATESAKRRQAEEQKRAQGLEIVNASLQTHRKALAERNNTINLSDEEHEHGKEILDIDANIDVQRVDDSQENLVPMKQTLVNKNDQHLTPMKRSHSDEADQCRRKVRIQERKDKGKNEKKGKGRKKEMKSHSSGIAGGLLGQSVEILQNLSKEFVESRKVHEGMLELEKRKQAATESFQERLLEMLKPK
ncbi:hypothetical protein DFJ43DRAFT_1037243 [Lentinula guzmanii]|uniref:Uncharacterized protein n=1 Tax=Lentinula guzmanii TaxID=2804957 RepID=A0AA38N3U8_9AGAR|nr:hypothetical protein DFJ43DRAFT_1037243 [Lentinula guzmanii]